MGKTLILLFDVDEYDLADMKDLSPAKRLEKAKKGVNKGTCDIFTVEDFCNSLNNGDDCLTTYWVLPCWVSEEEYEKWRK